MTQKDNILKELQELKSSLANHTPQNVYSVPAGYFDGLAAQMLTRIKAMEATTAGEELFYLSPVVNDLSKQVPYAVPAGYFEGLISQVLNRIKAMDAATASEELEMLSPLLSNISKEMPYTVPAGYFEDLSLENITADTDNLSAKEELETISPLLSSLKKEMPYSVPQGYFESLGADIHTAENKPAAKVVSLGSRKWFRYAAAAVVVGVIATIAFMFINRDKVTADQDSFAWVKKNVKKVSTEKLEEFIQLTDAEKSVASVDLKGQQEVKELVKDVPEDEIQNLLDDTKILEDADTDDASDEVFMN